MLCLFCSHDNPSSTRFCTKCNARVPEPPELIPSRRGPDLESIVLPKDRYNDPMMYDLSWSAYECIFEDGTIEDFETCFFPVRQRFADFSGDWPELEAALIDMNENYPDDPFPSQALFLAQRGIELYRQGLEEVENLLRQDDLGEELFAAVRSILDGNDHLTLCTILTGEAYQNSQNA